MFASVAVIGAGAWGTVIAGHLARRTDLDVTLRARNPEEARAIGESRVNARYLPGVVLPPSLSVTSDLRSASSAGLLIAATPSAGLLPLVDELLQAGLRAPLFWLCKGFLMVPPSASAPVGVVLPHQAVAPRWLSAVGVVSGPSFADEVARGLPTALVVAATDPSIAAGVAALLHGGTLRTYQSDDLTGIEIGGAVKNVLAIAAGASDGLGFGHNARAALITRGLAESGRLSTAMGGRRETLMGLAGLGDLVLTCTGDLSRNRRVGIALAQGRPLATILAELGHVAEGVGAARAVRSLARHHDVEMPICDAVYRVLFEDLAPRQAVESLLRREPRPEC